MKKPLVSEETQLNDITPRAVVLGCALAMLLSASTAYLALRIGVTISASIPTIALCVALFRFLKPSNVLEVNMIQTIASAGFVVGSVAAFILPGLIMVGVWKSFPYTYCFLPIAIGCVFGVFLSVPLRSYYFNQMKLRYPEGVAAASLIKESMHRVKRKGSNGLLESICLGSALQFLQEGLRIIPSTISAWKSIFGVPLGLTVGVTPSLIGVGYIIGLWESAVCFCATLVSIIIGVPVLGAIAGESIDPLHVEPSMLRIWAQHVRFVGVGVMLMGGFLLCFSLVRPILASIRATIGAAKERIAGAHSLRTERDIHIRWVLRSYVLFLIVIGITALVPFADIRSNLVFGILPTVLIVSVGSFIINAVSASIGGYMAGIVGSSYNPLSGVSIINICLFSMLLSLVIDMKSLCSQSSLVAVVLFLTTYAGGACCISSDNIQDLKTGHILGATPWKQQVGLILGSLCGALVVPFVLQLLFEAYGIGAYHPGAEGAVDPTKTLQAPKAVLLSSLAKAIFLGSLDWKQIFIGMGLGVLLHVANIFLKKRKQPTIALLSVGVGIYMPLEITASMFFGGLLFYYVNRKEEKAKDRLIVPSGLIAGEAIAGIFVAGLLMTCPQFAQWRAALTMGPFLGGLLSLTSFCGLCYFLYQYGINRLYPTK